MGIQTLISTATASGADEVDITSGITSAYDEYMFVFTDINPVNDGVDFSFQVNVAGASGFNETITSTVFSVYHDEADSAADLSYFTSLDQAQGTAFQPLADSIGNGADESTAGTLHLFNPSNTTYVKHFYCRAQVHNNNNYAKDHFTAGYFNVTGAIDEISFKMSAEAFDGVIQMYGIA